MKKLIMTVLSAYLVLTVYAQNTSSEVVEVTNYREVVSKIEYPRVCKEKGIEGKVIVSLEIDENGNLISHEFIKYPCSDLKEVVQNALPKLKFKPAFNVHGQAVASKITMPVNFKLTI